MMTTEEMVAELKNLGVADDWAEKTGDMRLVATTGARIQIPMVTEDGALVQVTAKISDEAREWIPEWESVRKLG